MYLLHMATTNRAQIIVFSYTPNALMIPAGMYYESITTYSFKSPLPCSHSPSKLRHPLISYTFPQVIHQFTGILI